MSYHIRSNSFFAIILSFDATYCANDRVAERTINKQANPTRQQLSTYPVTTPIINIILTNARQLSPPEVSAIQLNLSELTSLQSVLNITSPLCPERLLAPIYLPNKLHSLTDVLFNKMFYSVFTQLQYISSLVTCVHTLDVPPYS